MKISVAEILALMAFLSLTIGGLLSHATISWGATAINLVAILACLISAIVAVGPHRAFAISFLIPVAVYWGIVLTISDHELDMNSGRLPTSQLLQDVFLRPSHLASNDDVIKRREHASALMPCGHIAVSVMMGYIGGKYGKSIYESTRRPIATNNLD